MKTSAVILALASSFGLGSAAPTSKVDIYTANDITAMTKKLSAKDAPFGSQSLEKYGNHYTMLAHRTATGASEVHEKESDLFFVVEGNAKITTGGALVNSHTEKPGELRGTSIKGGQSHDLPQGSVIHIPAGVPHQMLIEKGQPVTYFVMKVMDQQ